MRNIIALIVAMFLASGIVIAQSSAGDGRKTASQPCQLLSANPPRFDPFQFVPKELDFTRLNRFPRVAYVVSEDGSVSNVKILKGTGSPKVDAALVKSIQAWKYKPQPGCALEISMVIVIDIGPANQK
jgi:TonB family protein